MLHLQHRSTLLCGVFFKYTNFIKLKLLKGEKNPTALKKKKVFLLLFSNTLVCLFIFFQDFSFALEFGVLEQKEEKDMTVVLG